MITRTLAALVFIMKIAAIMLAAWIFAELCEAVGSYLRKTRHEIGLMYKRQAIDELIRAANDKDVKYELRRIQERHQGLVIPLDSDDNAVQDDIRIVSARECSRDSVSDKVVIADDNSGYNR